MSTEYTALVPDDDFDGHFHLHCPICGFEYNHADWPLQMDGGVLGCRDDCGHGGLYIPIRGECGHEWGIGIANHKGYEVLGILPTINGRFCHQRFMPSGWKGGNMREPVVKVYKNRQQNGNGVFAVTTTAADAEEFLREAATVLPAVVEHLRGDLEFTFDALLPQICELWAKLRGYKADTVFERRLLIVGEPTPEAHMDYLNDAEPFDEAKLNGVASASDAA